MTQSGGLLSGQLATASVSEETCYKIGPSAAVSLRYKETGGGEERD